MYIQSLIVVLSTWTALTAAQCGRAQLITTRDDFFRSAKPGAAVSLARNAKIAYNNVITPLDRTPFASISNSTWTNLKIEAVDVERCTIATFRVSKEQLLSTRLKIDASNGNISEIEFLQVVSGDVFFLPSGFPKDTPELWTRKQIPTAPPMIPDQW
jgi:hypothetical protein